MFLWLCFILFPLCDSSCIIIIVNPKAHTNLILLATENSRQNAAQMIIDITIQTLAILRKQSIQSNNTNNIVTYIMYEINKQK